MDLRNRPSGLILDRPLAIVGLDIVLGSCDGLGAFEHAAYQGRITPAARPDAADAPDQPLPGNPIGRFSVEPSRLGLEEAELERISAPELLLLRVAAGALHDAGLEPGRETHPVAVLIAHDAPLQDAADAALAGRLLKAGRLSGPIRRLPVAEDLLANVLAAAGELLADPECDAVLAIASALRSDASAPDHGYAQEADAPLTLPFDSAFAGLPPAEGALAFVFKRPADAQRQGLRTYAILRAAAAPAEASAANGRRRAGIQSACRTAFTAAGLEPGSVAYLEFSPGGPTASESEAFSALTDAHPAAGPDLTCALGSAAAGFGWSGALAGLVSLARATLALHLRVLPATPGWTAPADPDAWAGSPFYVPTTPRGWFAPAGATRIAGLAASDAAGGFTYALLASAPLGLRAYSALSYAPLRLFPLASGDPAGLLDALAALKVRLAAGEDPRLVSAAAYQAFQQKAGAPFSAAILGSTAAEALREIDFALAGIPRALESGNDWQTPLGSYFTPAPLGRQGEIAFVYPGAFNSYPGVAQDVTFYYPQVFDLIHGVTEDPGGVLNEQRLYARSQAALTREEAAALETALVADPIAMLLSGTSLSVMYTLILRDIHAVHPHAAFGYSLGENSMMFATGVWNNADEASRWLSTQPLFHTRLAGPMNAVREAWGLPPQPADYRAEGFWANFVVMAPAERVAEVLQTYPHVYITHINTPRQVVIGGDPQQCQAVIAVLGCPSLKAPFDYALHCAAIAGEYPALARQHDWPVYSVHDIRLYTAADYRPVPLEQKAIAQRIGTTLVSQVDFPRLVRQAHADGARIFIELGAGANCSKWIDDTLKGQPYVSMALNRRGSDDLTSILRVLARLACHQVRSVDLAPLYAPDDLAQAAGRQAPHSISLHSSPKGIHHA